MATLWFNSGAVGGSGDGDYSNLLNFWQDEGDTIPNGAVPLSTDDVELQDNILTGTTSVTHNLDAIGNTMTGLALTIYGSVTGGTWLGGGGFLTGNSGTLNAIGTTFSIDPGGPISGTGTCNYNANITGDITDDGTGTFGAFTFSGAIVINGDYTSSSGATFSSTFNSHGINSTDTFNGAVTITGGGAIVAGNFNSTVTASVVGASITGGTFVTGNITGFTGINGASLSGNTITMFAAGGNGLGNTLYFGGTAPNTGTWTINSASFPSYNYTGSIQTGGGTIVYGIPNQTQVLNTITFGYGATGSLVVPADQYVLTGQGSGTLTLPTAANTIAGVVYGVAGNGSTGTYQRPNNEASDVLAKPYVDSTVVFGPAAQLQEQI